MKERIRTPKQDKNAKQVKTKWEQRGNKNPKVRTKRELGQEWEQSENKVRTKRE